jgi:hypothetical protein
MQQVSPVLLTTVVALASVDHMGDALQYSKKIMPGVQARLI